MISDPLLRILPTNMKKDKAYMSYVICNFAHNFGKIESIFISLLFFACVLENFIYQLFNENVYASLL